MDFVSLIAEVWMQDLLLPLLDFIYAFGMKLLGDFFEHVCVEQHTRIWELCS